ncbi:MAG: hypothetical protein EOS41_12335 [Mesorhizobium sp.]|uniref:hypothetical protein n=1 Tax=Mesorhizobium sp. TaxID=1871066 RepID=UPI000FEA9459|nr:hypothetical protein [Mesorhizobium sp.]RWE25229.1 MAG: hypothetical protein EOS41_12335 [Mesorhizobium sp.]
MATINAALAAIDRHIGFPQSRSRTVARRLQEANALPMGAPGVAPELDADDFLMLVVALAADTTLHEAPRTVVTYMALTPGGAVLGDDAPDSIPRNAGHALIAWSDQALHGDSDALRRDRIEVVAGWPELVIYAAGKEHRFVVQGTVASAWQTNGNRKSITLNGSALVDCLRELFGDKNA